MINSFKGPYGSIITKDLMQTTTKPARIRATATNGKTIIVSRTIEVVICQTIAKLLASLPIRLSMDRLT